MKRFFTVFALLCVFPFFALAEDSEVSIHGMASQGFIKSTGNNFFCESKKGTLEFNEFALNFVVNPTSSLRIGAQLFAHDFGDYGEEEVMIDWLVCDYQFNEKLGLRVGKIKMPMGLYNTNRDIDMLRTNIFMPQGVYAEEQRDANLSIRGAGIYGNWSSLEYEFIYGTTKVDENSIGVKISEEEGLTDVAFSIDHKYAGSLLWEVPIDGLRMGVTYQNVSFEINGIVTLINAPVVMDNKVFEVGTISAEYTRDRFQIVAEYLQRHMEFDIFPLGLETDEDAIGRYLKTSYRFTDWFELGAYYSEFYPRRDNKDGHRRDQLTGQVVGNRAWMKDWTTSLRFDINSYWIIKAEGHYIDGTAGLMTADNENGFERYWTMYALKATYSF